MPDKIFRIERILLCVTHDVALEISNAIRWRVITVRGAEYVPRLVGDGHRCPIGVLLVGGTDNHRQTTSTTGNATRTTSCCETKQRVETVVVRPKRCIVVSET